MVECLIYSTDFIEHLLLSNFCVVYWRAKIKDDDAEEAEPSVEDAVCKRCVGGSLERFQGTKERMTHSASTRGKRELSAPGGKGGPQAASWVL